MSAARPDENAAAEALPDDEGPSSEDIVVSPPSAPTETSAAREDEEEGDDTLLEDAPDDLARLTAKPPPPRPVPRASGLAPRKERSERKRIAAARAADEEPGADGSPEAASARSESASPNEATPNEAPSQAASSPAAANGSAKGAKAAAASKAAASKAAASKATAAKAADTSTATDDVDTVEDLRRRARVRKAERAKAAASKGQAKKPPAPWEDDTVLESRAELGPLPSSQRGLEDVERIGRYRVLKHIESGGFANVYLGRLVGLAGFGRFVALKRIHDHLAQQHEFVEMFLDEARLASAIDHPNVCAPIDFGRTEDGAYYLAMDYLLGEPLTSIRRAVGRAREEVGPEDMAFAVRVVADAAHGLHAAHEAHDVRGRPLEVVHRDVAPGNLFVLYSGHVKVVDFGIAHAARKLHTTKNGIFKGHLAFAAPEQVRAEPVDRRTDVWSLGVILWEMLARRRLFRQSHELALINAILVDPVPRLDELAPWVPEPLVELVHRCLERDRDERPETALELALELERQLGALGEPMGVHEVGSYVCALLPDRAHQKHRELWALAGDLQAEASSERALPPSEPPPPPRVPSQRAIETAQLPALDAPAAPPAWKRALPWVAVVAAAALFFLLGRGVAGSGDDPDATPNAAAPAQTGEGAPDEAGAVEAEERTPSGAVEIPEDEIATASEEPEQVEAGEAEEERGRARRRRRAARANGFVSVTTVGGWAEVYHGRRRLGVTPGRFELPSGRRRLRIVPNGGGRARFVWVRVPPGGQTRTRVELR